MAKREVYIKKAAKKARKPAPKGSQHLSAFSSNWDILEGKRRDCHKYLTAIPMDLCQCSCLSPDW